MRPHLQRTDGDIEPAGTYRTQYHLRWRRLARALDRTPRLKRGLAGLVRRALRRVFEPGLVTTERVVEYPFVFQHLAATRGPVLDVGSCDSRLPIALASRGCRVLSLDVHTYPCRHPGVQSVRGDILRAPFADGAFPAVIAISVIEHIGIGHYGDPLADDGDRRAVEEIERVLDPGGRAILTVPFGRAMTNDWMRVYDPRRLASLLSPLHTERVEYARSVNGLWRPAAEAEATQVDWTGPDRSVALIVARKSCGLGGPG